MEERSGGHVSEEGVLDSATTMMRMMKMVVAMQQRRKTGRRSSQRSRRGASLALGREESREDGQKLDDALHCVLHIACFISDTFRTYSTNRLQHLSI